MSTVRGSIDVAVPSGVAYEELSHLENYPHFMAGVTDVTPLSPTTAHMVMELAGNRTEFDACVITDRPGEMLSWETIDGPHLSETVRFERLSESTTRVIAELQCDATQFLPSETQAQEVLSRRLKADLAGFKQYVERTVVPGVGTRLMVPILADRIAGLEPTDAGAAGGFGLPDPAARPAMTVPNPNIMQGRYRPGAGRTTGTGGNRPAHGSNERPMRGMPPAGNLGPMQRPLARPPSHRGPDLGRGRGA